MHQEPAVQPMLHARLQVEQATFVAPALHLFYAHAVGRGDAQFQMAKDFFGFARMTEAKSFPAPRPQVRKKPALDEIRQDFF